MSKELEITLSLNNEASKALKAAEQETRNFSSKVQEMGKKVSDDLDKLSSNFKTFGREISQVGNTFALFGGVLTGPFVLALRNASKTSFEVKEEFEKLRLVTDEFQRQVAQAVIPILSRFTNILLELLDRFNSLDPAFKNMILQGTLMAGIFLTLGGGVLSLSGKIISLVANLGSLLAAFVAFSVANPIFLSIIVSVGALLALMISFKPVADTVMNAFEIMFKTLKAGFLGVKAANEEFIASIALGLSKILAGYASLGLAGSEMMTNMANDLAMVAGDFQVFATRDLHEAEEALKDIGTIISSGEGDWSKSFEDVKAKVEAWIESLKNAGTTTDETKANILEVNEEIRKTYEAIILEIERMPKVFGDAVGQAIVNGKNLTESLKEAFKNMAVNIISQIVQMVAQMLIFDKLLDQIKSKLDSSSKKKGFGGVLGGVVGSLFGGVGAVIGGLAGSFFHTGGIVKAHNGLAVDEVPIIAQKGEGILSRKGMNNLGGSDVLNALNGGAKLGGSGNNTEINIYISSPNMSSQIGITRTAEMLGSEIEDSLRRARSF